MKSRKTLFATSWWIGAVFIGISTYIFLYVGFKDLNNSIQQCNQRIEKMQPDSTLHTLNNSIQQCNQCIEKMQLDSQILLQAIMAEKVGEIIKGKNSTEDKVTAIASWVSSHIANNKEVGSTPFTWFATRKGLCGARSAIFQQMLEFINIPAVIFKICKFPTCAESHVTAQVYYDSGWHFFDVTYAGYFKKDGKILAFDELVHLSKKEDVLKYLIVFSETLDYHRRTAIKNLTNFQKMS